MSTPGTALTSPLPGAPPTDAVRAPILRAATAADLPAVERLLAVSGLPAAGVAAVFAAAPVDFVVADDPGAPGELAGVAGIEVRGEYALLRSLAVPPGWRAHGLVRELVRRLVCVAEGRGLHAFYLLRSTDEPCAPGLLLLCFLCAATGARHLSAQLPAPASPPAAAATPAEVVVTARTTAPLRPDRTTLTFEVAARGVGAAVAVERHAALLAAVAAAARAAGVPRERVTASPRTLGTGQWFNRATGVDSVGYVAQSTVRVTLGGPEPPGDEAAAARVVDAVRAAGATEFGGATRWAVDSAPAPAEAVARAVWATCEDVAAAARAAGRALGPLASVVVGEGGGGSAFESRQPPVRRDRLIGAFAVDPAARGPEPATVTAVVTARWTLRDGAAGASPVVCGPPGR
jgi:N-acetylglutamate synthase-like GNAT family acetyltransferase/uncharacterized protein YggE